jgi:very-short-patch-repair endonuclease
MTLPEVKLWLALRRGGVAGLKFRKQHPFGPFILDFYCEAAKLAVEVDGWSHNMGPLGRDERRDRWLTRQDVRVLRFTAEDVLKDLDGVVRSIEAAAPLSPLRPFGPLPPEGADEEP